MGGIPRRVAPRDDDPGRIVGCQIRHKARSAAQRGPRLLLRLKYKSEVFCRNGEPV
jgi:hypothetical protein